MSDSSIPEVSKNELISSSQRTYFVHGMYCKGCEIAVENLAKQDAEIVSRALADLKKRTITIEIHEEFYNLSDAEIINRLNPLLHPEGYSLSVLPEKKAVAWYEFKFALPLAATFLGLFWFASQNWPTTSFLGEDLNYTLIFLAGVVASLSSCAVLTSGLILGLTTNWTKNIDNSGCCADEIDYKPHLIFHFSRLVAFFTLGGIIGLTGQVIQIGQTGSLILNGIVALTMFILGINLLDIFQWSRNFSLSWPRWLIIGTYTGSRGDIFSVILLGISTFFLPCGITQSIQLYSLSRQNMWEAALTMLVFAMGTLPVLSLFSLFSLNLRQNNYQKYLGYMFKTAGLIIIGLTFWAIYQYFQPTCLSCSVN